MNVKFAYSCTCGANDFAQHDEESLNGGEVLIGNCISCPNTVVIVVNELDREKKVVDYTVQIRKTERADC
ncbi:MAG: hypothetical protein KDK51_10555 [Deltaproteobacteria bacterium]|nr:hypothetical protein [Deltaproteobacteria bacterium]